MSETAARSAMLEKEHTRIIAELIGTAVAPPLGQFQQATNETIAQSVTKLADATKGVVKRTEAVAEGIRSEFEHYTKSVRSSADDMAVAIQQLGKDIDGAVARGMAAPITALQREIGGCTRLVGETKHQVEQARGQIERTDKHVEQVRHQIDQTGKQVEQVRHQIDQTGKQVEQVRHQVDQTGKQVEQVRHQIDQTGKQVEQVRHQIDQSRKHSDESLRTLWKALDQKLDADTAVLQSTIAESTKTSDQGLRYIAGQLNKIAEALTSEASIARREHAELMQHNQRLLVATLVIGVVLALLVLVKQCPSL